MVLSPLVPQPISTMNHIDCCAQLALSKLAGTPCKTFCLHFFFPQLLKQSKEVMLDMEGYCIHCIGHWPGYKTTKGSIDDRCQGVGGWSRKLRTPGASGCFIKEQLEKLYNMSSAALIFSRHFFKRFCRISIFSYTALLQKRSEVKTCNEKQ